jgi:dTDP-4-amino-4,6-dideoxygalactose transaminase
MIAYESRASVILYHLLCSQEDRRPVLIPVNVCSVVPLTFRKAGRPFSFVDIGESDLALDQNQCLERIRGGQGQVGGLLYVRPYGAQEDVDGFFRAAKQYDPTLIVIDDKCLCPPDLSADRLSAVADASLFSTGRAKYVDAGGGGFAHLADGVPYHRQAALMRDDASLPPASNSGLAGSGQRRRPMWENPAEPAADETLDLSAPTHSWEAYERQVRALTRVVADHKRRLNAIYSAVIPEHVHLEARFQSWRFNILVPEPDRLIERLFAEGLFASRHYAPLGGIVPGAARFPRAERLHQSIVNLFNDRYFDEPRAERTAALVREHVLARGVQSDIVETL